MNKFWLRSILSVLLVSLTGTILACNSHQKRSEADTIECARVDNTEVEQEKIIIELTDNDKMIFRNEICSIAMLTNKLTAVHRKKEPINVLLIAPSNVVYTRVIEILDALRGMGITQVSISLLREDENADD